MENNNESIAEDKTFTPKTNEQLNAEDPKRKKRRQATPEELSHPLHGVKLKEILDTAMIMGFERNMFIDIKWSNEALWQEHLGIRKKCERPSKINTKFKRIKNHKKSLKTYNGLTLQEVSLPKSLAVKELVSGLYEIEGYDYFTISKVNKRIREKTYNGKFLDLKNGIR